MRTVIIGGGAVGLMTAYHLAREGTDVVVVDARATGRGAAEVNAGWFCPGESAPVPGPGMIAKSLKWMMRPDSPLYIQPSLDPNFARFMFGMWRACTGAHQREGYIASIALAQGSTGGYEEYRADGIDFELRTSGLLLAFTTPQNLEHHSANLDVAKRFGLDPEVLIGDDVRVKEPLLTDHVHGGIWFPHEQHLDPGALMQGLRRRLRELGAVIVENAPVTSVQRDGRRVTAITAGDEVIEADEFVLSAGAWSGRVGRHFDLSLPIRPGKGYSIDVPPLALSTCTNLSDAKVAVTPLHGRLRLAGTMEFGKLEEGHNAVRVAAILRAPERYLRGFEAPDPSTLEPRAGLRPMTPDGLPIIGRAPNFENLTLSTGHGMMGITFGPGSATAVADLVLRNRVSRYLEPFSPARFSRKLPRQFVA